MTYHLHEWSIIERHLFIPSTTCGGEKFLTIGSDEDAMEAENPIILGLLMYHLQSVL